METSIVITSVFFVAALVGGLFVLKYLERRLGIIREKEDEEEAVIQRLSGRPPSYNRLDDIDFMAEWFVRRDGKINNPLLSSMIIVENLAEETKVELDRLKTRKHEFNRYLGDLVDFLPKVDQAEQVLKKHYALNPLQGGGLKAAGKGTENSLVVMDPAVEISLKNIKSYIIAKIRILGWLYYLIYKKWYNQRDSEYLDFTEYLLSEARAGNGDSSAGS